MSLKLLVVLALVSGCNNGSSKHHSDSGAPGVSREEPTATPSPAPAARATVKVVGTVITRPATLVHDLPEDAESFGVLAGSVKVEILRLGPGSLGATSLAVGESSNSNYQIEVADVAADDVLIAVAYKDSKPIGQALLPSETYFASAASAPTLTIDGNINRATSVTAAILIAKDVALANLADIRFVGVEEAVQDQLRLLPPSAVTLTVKELVPVLLASPAFVVALAERLPFDDTTKSRAAETAAAWDLMADEAIVAGSAEVLALGGPWVDECKRYSRANGFYLGGDDGGQFTLDVRGYLPFATGTFEVGADLERIEMYWFGLAAPIRGRSGTLTVTATTPNIVGTFTLSDLESVGTGAAIPGTASGTFSAPANGDSNAVFDLNGTVDGTPVALDTSTGSMLVLIQSSKDERSFAATEMTSARTDYSDAECVDAASISTAVYQLSFGDAVTLDGEAGHEIVSSNTDQRIKPLTAAEAANFTSGSLCGVTWTADVEQGLNGTEPCALYPDWPAVLSVQGDRFRIGPRTDPPSLSESTEYRRP